MAEMGEALGMIATRGFAAVDMALPIGRNPSPSKK